MKNITLLVFSACLVILLANAPKARAQGKIGVNGLAAIPTGDFGQVASTGYGLNINPMFYLGPNVALGLSAGYQNYGEEEEGLRFSVIPLTLEGEYYFIKKGIRPYLGIGGGAFIVSTKVSNSNNNSDISSEGYFGIAPKAGVFLNFKDQFGINISTKYQMIFLEEETWSAITPELGVYILIKG